MPTWLSFEWLVRPWPWYVAGPLIGLMVPLSLLVGGRMFAVSASLRHMCAATWPGPGQFFRYDWRRAGGWNLAFAAGILAGGFVAGRFLGGASVDISAATRADLAALGLRDFSGFVPMELFSWQSVTSLRGFVLLVVGGFLVGFGSRYASGCTSGHAISGLATFQVASLVAIVGFFIGGLLSTFVLLPLIF